MAAKSREYTKNQWIVYFKRVNFMVYELYLNFFEQRTAMKILKKKLMRGEYLHQILHIKGYLK